jgi:hypothetical protein
MNFDEPVSMLVASPFEAGLEGQASNHPMLLRSKGVVMSDGEKADLIRPVSAEKLTASEPSMANRNAFQLQSKRVEACAVMSEDAPC